MSKQSQDILNKFLNRDKVTKQDLNITLSNTKGDLINLSKEDEVFRGRSHKRK